MTRKERRKMRWEQVGKAAKANPRLFWTYMILRIFVLGVMVLQILNRDYMNVFLCVLTLFLFTIPTFVERRIKIDIPNTLEVLILLFIFAAEILGEINEYYVNVPYWDTMLHTANGFLSAAVGMALIDVLNRQGKLSLNMTPVFVALVALCFSMTVGVAWEFIEYLSDVTFQLDMQKDTVVDVIRSVTLHPEGKNIPVELEGIYRTTILSQGGETVIEGYLDIGLIDTMRDLIVNFLGAAVFAIIGAVYIKYRGEGRGARFVRRFLLTSVSREDAEDEG